MSQTTMISVLDAVTQRLHVNARREVPSLPIDQAPFRWTARERHTLATELQGQLPAWLHGDLVRTAPAIFQTQGWAASHWFDALGLVYGFRVDGAAQAVSFKQRLLASRYATRAERGRYDMATFATAQRRNLVSRLLAPVPEMTDNANVNIVPWQDGWLAMTETAHQHVIDGETLASRGLYEYRDQLPRSLSTIAHPHYDFVGNALVNIGILFGRKSELWVLRQGPHEPARTVEAKLPFARLPYVHDFGLTERSVVVIDHPLRVNPTMMLFSDRPLIEHFKWRPETGTRLWRLDRRSGRWTSHETETLFCFHVVNTYEDGDETVFDFVAYDDPSVIPALQAAKLTEPRELPLLARYVRARLVPGKRRAELETLSSQRFEFPNIAYRREHGQRYRVAWGTALRGEGRWASDIVRVDNERGDVRQFGETDVVYGEPVFVPQPGAARATEGVVLTVGSHMHEDRATLAVLDADSLEPIAHARVELALPLGFHGTFKSR